MISIEGITTIGLMAVWGGLIFQAWREARRPKRNFRRNQLRQLIK
jgi:hypothetical protein